MARVCIHYLGILLLLIIITSNPIVAEVNHHSELAKKVIQLISDRNIDWTPSIPDINPFLDSIKISTTYKGLGIVVSLCSSGDVYIFLGDDLKAVAAFQNNNDEAIKLRQIIKQRFGPKIIEHEAANLKYLLDRINQYLSSQNDRHVFSVGGEFNIQQLRNELANAITYLYRLNKIHWSNYLSAVVGLEKKVNVHLQIEQAPRHDGENVLLIGDADSLGRQAGLPLDQRTSNAIGISDSLEYRYRQMLDTQATKIKQLFVKTFPMQDGPSTVATLDYQVEESLDFVIVLITFTQLNGDARKSIEQSNGPIIRYTDTKGFVITVDQFTIETWLPSDWTTIILREHQSEGCAIIKLSDNFTKELFKEFLEHYYEEGGYAERDRIQSKLRDQLIDLFLKP